MVVSSSESFLAEMQFLVWRDAQMAAITRQLQREFPELLGRLEQLIADTDMWQILRSSAGFKANVSGLIDSWQQEQLVRAMSRAEGALENAIALAPMVRRSSADTWGGASDVVAEVAKGGILAASLASVPAVISFATVSGGGLLGFFAATTLLWPVLIVGLAGVAGAALLGVRTVDGLAKLRTRAAENLAKEAARTIFGIGQKPGATSILSNIQAAVLQAGINRLKAL